MRTTTFIEKRLFNDTFSEEDTSFMLNWKGCAESKLAERKRGTVAEKGVGNKLDRWSLFMKDRERVIQGPIKMARISDGWYSLHHNILC